MFRFRTLTQRFGALYAVVVAILIGVTVVVIVHLRNIDVDSQRLIEEAREQTLTARMLTQIASLGFLLEQPAEIVDSELQRARELLRTSRSELVDMEGGKNDPSRPEHQRSEVRIYDRLAGDLQRVDTLLATPPSEEERTEALTMLRNSRHYAEVLLAEARDEAHDADQDLRGRARTTRLALLITWAAAVLLLGMALMLIHRGVVRPLRTLRAGTERFGRGERAHRIEVDNTDEIGNLAESFNMMADRLVGAHDDLEERVRKRTREFLRAARLADLGILASGIAHEINTPLASIASSAEGLERRCDNGEVTPELLREYSRTISEEAFRAREITTRMLALVRQEPSDISRFPLELLARQAETALRHRADTRGVHLVRGAVGENVYVTANAGELVQILVNLLANAVDASAPGARVEFAVGGEQDELRLEVADEGSGIAEENLERVFEPFYTTKRAGEGTGLGLALVATMVEFRGGRISVDSEVDRGTTFRVTLPMDWSRPA